MLFPSSKSIKKDWTYSNIPDLSNRVALVTGANSGLGFCTAEALANKNCHVILSCRTLEKSIEAKEKIINKIPKASLSCIDIDLSDLKKVSEGTKQIENNFEHLDLLINNAGIMHPPKTLSSQGYEIQFAVNHLAHMLITLKLLPLISKVINSRIITITSGAQFFGKTGWDNLKAEKYYNKWESYANSKLANIMFAIELHYKLKEKDISSLAAHPGIAKTNLFAAQKPKPSTLEKFSLNLFSPFFQSAEMGALPQLYAATSLDAKSGEHYGPRYNFRGYPKLSPTANAALDKEERRLLWDKSLNIINNFL